MKQWREFEIRTCSKTQIVYEVSFRVFKSKCLKRLFELLLTSKVYAVQKPSGRRGERAL